MAAITPSQADDIRTLHRYGFTMAQIAERFGCSEGTIYRVFHPEGEKRAFNHVHSPDGKPATRLSKADIAARFAEIPADTRSLTAAAFGDPIPNDPRRTWCPWLNRGTA